MTRATTGPQSTSVTGTDTAKRIAVVLLEVLSGVCGAAEGSRRLGLSLTRYYALETRGLQAFVHALEPRPRGRALRPDGPAIQRERQRLEGEVLRLQALVRTMQRAIAIAPSPKDAARRRRKVAPRARKVIAQLRPSTAESAGGAAQ
jgi:hypothetical protein